MLKPRILHNGKKDVSRDTSSLVRDTAEPVAWLVLLAICLGYFMVILDTTIVNVATLNIREQLGADTAGLQWVLDGYTLTFASFLLTAGALGDRFGSRRMYLVGLALFT